MSVCVCVYPVYMSCVHRCTVHQYKLCIVVQYICTWIYIYKPICPWVCPVYMSCPFLIHRCGVRGRTWAFPVSGNLEFFTLCCISTEPLIFRTPRCWGPEFWRLNDCSSVFSSPNTAHLVAVICNWSERRCADGFVESAVGHYFWYFSTCSCYHRC